MIMNGSSLIVIFLSITLLASPVSAACKKEAQELFDSWTGERIANAVPRDLTLPVDEDGGNNRNLLRDGDSFHRHAQSAGISEDIWRDEGALVAETTGRIVFQIGRSDFLCSGTVVTDSVSGRSIIITAAHCVYDDATDRFASNVIFIPNQDEGGPTDRNCNNDPLGCWRVGFGVVDEEWTRRIWPNNQQWDYAFYVVEDEGEHLGAGSSVPDALDQAVSAIDVSFNRPNCNSLAMIGYSGNTDPNLEYCVQSQQEFRSGYVLPNCLLGSGSSGGPGMCGSDEGDGPIVSVVSYSFQQRFGPQNMGGPYLFSNSAECLFSAARSSSFSCGSGVVVSYNANTGSCSTNCDGVVDDNNNGGDDSDGDGSDNSGGGNEAEEEGSQGLQCFAISESQICGQGSGCPSASNQAGSCCACARVSGCTFWEFFFPRTYCVGVWA